MRGADPGLALVPRRPRDSSAALVRATRAERLAERQGMLIALLAGLLDAPDAQGALDELAGELQRRFECDRVAIGLVERGELALRAVSQQGTVDDGAAEARLLLDAMDEALEAERTVRWPPAGSATEGGDAVPIAHRTLAGRRDDALVATVPMYRGGEPAGALLFERRGTRPFAPATLELLERVALACCPLLGLRREAERGTLSRARTSLGRRARALLGSERTGARLALAGLAAALAAGLLVPVTREVVAEAELVPSARRLVTAPVTGFVEEVLVGPGERVVPGQPLARLDRRELELEAVRRDNEIRTAEAEFRAAMASHDRRETAVARARLERARALRALVEGRLERSELTAPIAGLVIGADPFEATGAPVERGDVLFEIAPADDYEVHLLVDEADVREVAAGRRGALALKARPGDALGFTVRSVHPVAESEGGATRFRARASLDARRARGERHRTARGRPHERARRARGPDRAPARPAPVAPVRVRRA